MGLLVIGIGCVIVAIVVLVLAASIGSTQTTGVARSLELLEQRPNHRRGRQEPSSGCRTVSWARCSTGCVDSPSGCPRRHRYPDRALPRQGGQPSGVDRRAAHGREGPLAGRRRRHRPPCHRLRRHGSAGRRRCRPRRASSSRTCSSTTSASSARQSCPGPRRRPRHADRVRRGRARLRRGDPPGRAQRQRPHRWRVRSRAVRDPDRQDAGRGVRLARRAHHGPRGEELRQHAGAGRPSRACRSASCCGSRPRRCASSVVSGRRRRRRRSPSRSSSRCCCASSRPCSSSSSGRVPSRSCDAFGAVSEVTVSGQPGRGTESTRRGRAQRSTSATRPSRTAAMTALARLCAPSLS